MLLRIQGTDSRLQDLDPVLDPQANPLELIDEQLAPRRIFSFETVQ